MSYYANKLFRVFVKHILLLSLIVIFKKNYSFSKLKEDSFSLIFDIFSRYY